MHKILKLNKINDKAEAILTKGFIVSDTETNPEGIIVRSAKMHDYKIQDSLLAVARAGAGVNNIPVEKFKEHGIVVFNTPGANANAVKELVLCSMLLASRDIVQGVNWVNTLKGKGNEVASLVEKGKANFAGRELRGKTLGVIGLGAIGSMVAQAAISLKMDVIGYDPYITVDNAWTLNSNVKNAKNINTLICNSDYITIHSPLNNETTGMLNSSVFEKMKEGVCIINCARGELINNTDLVDAIASGKVAKYITDFPTDELVNVENVITIPHLGASTREAEINCAMMAANELKEYLELGNIINSVNYPNLSLTRTGDTRITLNLTSQSVALTKAPEILNNNDYQITGMISGTKSNATYMIIDVTNKPNAEIINKIKEIDGVIKIRLIK